MLGGETLTEVNSTGRKIKTNVIAAGAKIATQSQYTYNSTDHESIAFHHADASAMSHRSTMANGTALYGDGQFDGQPAETDPMGGNMGLSTPYIELLPPPEEPNPDWGFIPLESDAPMFVNGQRVTCSLDGFAIGCSQALGMLGHSADIDFANTDPWVLSGLGISWIRREYADNYAPTPPGGDPDTAYATTRYEYEYFFSNVSWSSQIDRIIPLPKDLGDRVNRMGSPGTECAKAVERLIDKLGEMTGRKLKKKTDLASLFKNIGAGRIKLDETLPAFEGRTGGTSTAFGSKIRIGPARESIFKSFPTATLADVYDGYARVVIHELIHNAANKGTFTDPEVLDAAIALLKEDGLEAPDSTDNVNSASQRINSFYLGRYCRTPFASQNRQNQEAE